MGSSRSPLSGRTLERLWRGEGVFYPGSEVAKDSQWDANYEYGGRSARVSSPYSRDWIHVSLWDGPMCAQGVHLNESKAQRSVSRWLFQGLI